MRFAAVYLTVDGVVRLVPLAGLKAAIASLPEVTREQIATLYDRLVAPRPAIAGLAFERPHVMGIVNVTPDSFSDGGRSGDPAGIARGMAAMGAIIIDGGGESTRPRADPVSEAEELKRVCPVLAALKSSGLTVSIDTRKSGVMAAGLDGGAAVINDVSALTYDPASLALVAARGCPVVLMHSHGAPATMQDAPVYANVLHDVFDWLKARIGGAGSLAELTQLGGGLGSLDSVTQSLSGSIAGSGSAHGSKSVNARTGSANANAGLAGTIAGAAQGATDIAAPAGTPAGKGGVSGSGSVTKNVNLGAQAIGTDQAGALAGSTTGMARGVASGAASTARTTAADGVGQARGAVTNGLASAQGTSGSAAGSAMGAATRVAPSMVGAGGASGSLAGSSSAQAAGSTTPSRRIR